MTATNLSRRTPQQARGQRRIAAILDAAEQVLAEDGFEAATTNKIAARANTSIGSLYQFFKNKDEIVQALEAKYLATMQGIRDVLLAPDVAGIDLETWIDRTIDMLAETQRAHAGFKAVFCSPFINPLVAEADNELQHEIRQRVDAMLAAWAPDLPESRRALYVTVSISVVKALLPLLPPKGEDMAREALLNEIKALLGAYLGPVFGGRSV